MNQELGQKTIRVIWHLPRNLAIFLVRLYQKTLSPDHGVLMRKLFPNGHCRFQPTCSEYAVGVLKKYGLIRGMLKAGFRVLRCNPWGKGGLDLP